MRSEIAPEKWLGRASRRSISVQDVSSANFNGKSVRCQSFNFVLESAKYTPMQNTLICYELRVISTMSGVVIMVWPPVVV